MVLRCNMHRGMQARAMFEKWDKNGDGQISIQEFAEMWGNTGETGAAAAPAASPAAAATPAAATPAAAAPAAAPSAAAPAAAGPVAEVAAPAAALQARERTASLAKVARRHSRVGPPPLLRQ